MNNKTDIIPSDVQQQYDDAEVVQSQPQSLVHPMSAICLIALDGISGGGEIMATPTVAGVITLSILVGIVSMIAVTMIEKGMNRRSLIEAMGVGITLGILAGVPYPVLGTTAGVAILGWSGLRQLKSR
jgi:hypothetical protein